MHQRDQRAGGVVPQTLDVYGRIVAEVYVNDQNVAAVLAAEGYAKRR